MPGLLQPPLCNIAVRPSTVADRRRGTAWRVAETSGTPPVNIASIWGRNPHAFWRIQRLTSSPKKRSGTISGGSMCIWPTIVIAPPYFHDDLALRYRSAQTRLFGLTTGCSCCGSGSRPETRTCQPRLYLGSKSARFLAHSAFDEFSEDTYLSTSC